MKLLGPLNKSFEDLPITTQFRWIFGLALVCELISLVFYFNYFDRHRYLPAPFFLDKNDTFMDFYHPLFWALRDEFYTTFHSVYPPLNFLILKLIGWCIHFGGSKSAATAFELRQNSVSLTLIVCGIYLAIIAFVVNLGQWGRLALGDRALVFGVCALSAPVLFGLERGNMIFFGLPLMALYLDSKSSAKKALYLAALINIKPYFLVLLIRYMNLRSINKKMITQVTIFTAVIFFVLSSFAGLDCVKFFQSYFLFLSKYTITAEGAVGFAHNLAALARIKELIYFGQHQHYSFWFSVLKVMSSLSILILVYQIILKPLSQLELIIGSVVILTNFSVSTGGYILMIYILLIPYLFYSPEYRFLLVPILGIFTFPLDWINLFSIPATHFYSYLGNTTLLTSAQDYQIAAGSVVRPLLNFSVLSLFSVHLVGKYHFLRSK